ncbi:hypothetical protein QUF49_05265 [Fictibacillus sp. b24]|uniref:hypothetical protein n=1 Tax=Fictibacillus sp. b24 TaxID=3055863 RepID=UPI0025A1AA31|nr:hypothetical protein [Fictibacillus sp. b24]MDM5315396.1 hypothetical protein [Fictibacillus sp. b24]
MRDSCGTGGQVRHLRVKRTNVAHRLPRGKRASWSGNQPRSRTTKTAKTRFFNEISLEFVRRFSRGNYCTL